MITSTGNNFGGGAISFKAVDKEEYLVLNGIVEIDTEESEYQAASVLEIYVPDLKIPKSLETLVYLARNKNGFNTMILAKTWIKDKNTICIEKIDNVTENGTITLTFCCMYVTKGKSITSVPFSGTELQFEVVSGIIKFQEQNNIITDEFMLFCNCRGGINIPQGYEPFEIEITGLPDGLVGDFPIIGLEYMYVREGNLYTNCHLEDGKLTTDGFRRNFSGNYAQYYVYAVIVR